MRVILTVAVMSFLGWPATATENDYTEGPLIEGNYLEFHYVLTHYVVQDRAEMRPISVPLNFGWRCTDEITHCIERGNKCQLPAEYYATEYERAQCRK